MLFLRPTYLWLLLLVIPLVVLHLRHRTGLAPVRATLVAVLRIAAFVALVIALARPLIRGEDPTRTVVAVADLSQSVGDGELAGMQERLVELASGRRTNERLRLVVFGRAAQEFDLNDVLGRGGSLAAVRGVVDGSGSSLGDALQLAGALIPHDGRGRIELLTDGLETRGDALSEAYRLADRGIEVVVNRVGSEREGEVVLRSASMPPAAGVGATVELEAVVESSYAGQARLIVKRDGDAEEIVRPFGLVVGEQLVACDCPLIEEGLNRYSVRVESEGDRLVENNSLVAAVNVLPSARVCVVEDDGLRPAAKALAPLLGSAARVRSLKPESLKVAGTLDDVDVLVIGDTPAEAIGADGMAAVRDAVTSGMGLLTTGGRRAYGPGGYADTALAEVLPVRFSQEVERRDPSTTLVVIIDTSGSMGGSRVNLAKEIARLAIARLKPHDKVGIVEFYGSKRWAAPIQPASNAIDVQRALNRLAAGGGTVILPAIEEAYYALLNVNTRTKHVLVLTDGGVEQGAFEPMIRRMADARMTLSTVLVGPGTHSSFLANLAQWGRGRFYTAPDRFNLPEVITKQPASSMLSPLVEKPARLVLSKSVAFVEDVDFEAAPAISGYVKTEARPTADVVLTSDAGHPLLAQWRYGLGAVASLTTHVGGEWTSELVQWQPYATAISGLVRSLCRVRPSEALEVVATSGPEGTGIEITNRLPDAIDGFGAVEVTATDESGKAGSWVVDPVQPNRWRIQIDGDQSGVVKVEVKTVDGGLGGSGAVVTDVEREICRTVPDDVLLGKLAEVRGLAAKRASEVAGVGAERVGEAWSWFAGMSLLLMLVNVAVRRWPSAAGGVGRSSAAVSMLAAIVVVSAAGTAVADEKTVKPVADVPAEARVAIDEYLASGGRSDADESYEKARQSTLLRDGDLESLVVCLQKLQADGRPVGKLLLRAAGDFGDLDLAHETAAALSKKQVNDAGLLAEIAKIEELRGDDQAALSSLDKAIGIERDATRKFALGVRKALILYDSGKGSEAAEALRTSIKGHPSEEKLASYCAQLAAVNGDYGLALELLKPSGSEKEQFHDHLFRGLWLLRVDDPAEARHEYESAYELAPLSRDRRFALERVVAAAREAGELGDLADSWLADGEMNSSQMAVLATVLRELGRSQEALELLKNQSPVTSRDSDPESAELQKELIAVAVEAGKEGEAERLYRDLLAEEPRNISWRVGLARLLLLDGHRDEAAGLFEEAVSEFDSAQSLLDLAESARQLALDDAALAAARKAAKGRKSGRVMALIFEADLSRQRGETERASELLRELSEIGENDDGVLLLTAEAFERYGDSAEALRLFRKLYERTESEDVLLRVAWLLEGTGRLDEAQALWKRMWQTTEVAARLRQSQGRLLDLASRNGTLADLAIEIEEKLDAGAASQRELSLLVDIYTAVNDPISAAEILYAFGKQTGDRVETLKRLSRVFLSCEQFGRCNSVLRKLVSEDPENAADYLNQMAMVALERNQPHQAREALAELAKVGEDPALVDEFSAGVLNMIGLHEEAARAYGRLMARFPDRIESCLIKGEAMKAAGLSDRAIVQFQNLIEEAAEDDLFTVAVDGLLNLDAGKVPLRVALRRIRARIAAKPNKLFLYRLGADISETLREPSVMTGLLEQAVVIAGERRGPLLRELMDGAGSEGKTEEQIRFGRSLLAMSGELPPAVYLDLGEAMVREGQYSLAERVFDRAGDEGDYSAIQQRVADCYERANQPEAANRIIRQLLASEPDNVALLIKSGDLHTQLGRVADAFGRYHQAVDLMLRRLPLSIGEDDSEGSESEDQRAMQGPRIRDRKRNLGEFDQYFWTTATGLLASARDESSRKRLLDGSRIWVETELSGLKNSAELAAHIASNPRMEKLGEFARRVCLSLGDFAGAEQIDESLLTAYPTDPKLRLAIVRSRLDWELFDQAVALSDGLDEDKLPPAIVVHDLLEDEERLQATLATGQIKVRLAKKLASSLVMQGRDEDVVKLLRVVDQEASPATVCVSAKLFIAAAIAIDDAEAARLWMNRWLESIEKSGDGNAAALRIRECVGVVWNMLGSDERDMLAGRVDRICSSLEPSERFPVDLLRIKLAESLGRRVTGLDELLERGGGEIGLQPREAALLLRHAPPDKRAGLLGRMVGIRKAKDRRSFLMDLAGEWRGEADDQLVESFDTLFAAAPPERLDSKRVYSQILGNWVDNDEAGEIGRRIGEVLLGEMPSEPAVLVAVALAREHAGLHEEALILASEALEALLQNALPDFQHRRMLGAICPLFDGDSLSVAIEDIDELIDIDGQTPMLLLAKGELLWQQNRRLEALEAYRRSYELAPTNRVVSRTTLSRFEKVGKKKELAELLGRHLSRSTIMESYEWRTYSELSCSLYDPLTALVAANKDEGPLAPAWITYIERMLERHDDLRMTFLRYMAMRRNAGNRFLAYWPVEISEGGMEGFLNRPPVGIKGRKSMLAVLATEPFALEEYDAMLNSVTPDSSNLAGLAEAILKALQNRVGETDLLGELSSRVDLGMLTRPGFWLLYEYANQSKEKLPDHLCQLVSRSMANSTAKDEESLAALGEVVLACGNEKAGLNILRWLVALDLVEGHSPIRLDDRITRMERYVSLLSEKDRPAVIRKYWDQLAPTPFDVSYGELESARLRGYASLADSTLSTDMLQPFRNEIKPSSTGQEMKLVAAALACVYARNDQYDEFAGCARAAMTITPEYGREELRIEIADLLPPAGQLNNPLRYVNAVVDTVCGLLSDGELSEMEATKLLCLAGRWCVQNGFGEAAEALARRAKDLAGDPGEHWLWISDLLRLAGQLSPASEIETELVELDIFPVMRISRLLDEIEANKGRNVADTLAVKVASYSDHPQVLRRAIRSALCGGDAQSAKEYFTRLEATSPSKADKSLLSAANNN